VLALINSFEQTLRNAVMEAVQAGRGQALKRRLKLVVRALVMVHYRRPRLNRMLEAEEERLGGAAEDSAFHGIVLQLLREHKNEVMPII
jgi:hypothetical protein